MVSVARHAPRSSATGVLPKLAWDSGCTGLALPFCDSYWEELNCNRLGWCFSEESLSYCKRGSLGRCSQWPSEEVHGQAWAGDALPPPPNPFRLPGLLSSGSSSSHSRRGGGGISPSPSTSAPLPQFQPELSRWGPVPPLTGTDSHLVPGSIRVPSRPSHSVSLSWTK